MAAMRDLVDEVPRSVDDKEFDPLPARMQEFLDGLPWVRGSNIRLREEGRFLTGTIYVQPCEDRIDSHWIRDVETGLRGLHWRVGHVSVVPVPDLGEVPGARTE